MLINNTNNTFGLLLESGVYEGNSNRNITLPPWVVWIKGIGSVVFEASYDATAFSSVLSINFPIAISGVTFSAVSLDLSYIDSTSAISIFDYAPASIYSFANVSFFYPRSYNPPSLIAFTYIDAYLYSRSQLLLEGVVTNALSLVTISSLDTSSNECPRVGYDFPLLSVSELSISGADFVFELFASAPLFSTFNVDLLLSNTTISNSNIGSIASLPTYQQPCFDKGMSTTTVNNLSVRDSSIAGGITALRANISGVSVTNCRVGSLGVLNFFWGSASDVNISENTYVRTSQCYCYCF